MTAFAAVESTSELGTLRMELRAVNHRYLELGFRLPEDLRSLESLLRTRVQEKVQRGKLDLTVRFRPAAGAASRLHINQALLDGLCAALDGLRAQRPQLSGGDPLALLAFPGVIEQPELDQSALLDEVRPLLDRLLGEFDANRLREGEALTALIRDRASQIAAIRLQALELMPAIREGQRAKLETRLADLKQPLEAGRIEQELVLFLQKLDVEEELDRLAVHLKELERALAGRDAVGRRLDFLLQEFNREANTFGSKSVDGRTSSLAVDLKVLIEQIREQVQNLE
jgi:uncharacterized protein (TIGR00255 family)